MNSTTKNCLKKTLYFSLIWSSLSCNNQKNDLENLYGFSTTEKLKSEILENGSNAINKATNLYLFNSSLFIGDRDLEYHFKVIDINEDRLISRFAKEGEGPCEVTFPVRLNWLDSDQGQISLYDRQRFKIHTYLLDDILNKENPPCLSISDYMDSNFQLVAQVDSSNFVGTGLFEGRYATQKSGTNEAMESTIGFPKNENEQNINYQTLAMAYQGKLLKHPHQNKFVSTTLFAFSFDILAMNESNELKLINQIHHWAPDFQGTTGNVISAVMKEGNKFGCLDVAVSESFIYILFSGKSNTLEDSRESELVMVYDWDGKPKKIISLDKPISKLAVDITDDILVGFVDSADPQLLKFSLN